MKCPDCSGMLVDITLTGIDKSFRCFTCGGMWVMAKTVNGLPAEDLSSQWKKINIDETRIGAGDDACPYDQTKLEKYEGSLVPAEFKVRQCPTCHWWWFPGDTLFKFKPLQEKRVSDQAKVKPLLPMLMAALIPLMSLALLITGGIVGVRLLGGEQKVEVAASGRLKDVSGLVFENGSAIISFSYLGDVNDASIYLSAESKWVSVKVSKTDEGKYQIMLGSFVPTAEGLTIRIEGEETRVIFRSINPE